MTSRVAFIGLGVMGHAMAGHLARAGHRIAVFNRTRARAEAWLAEYGEGGAAAGVANTPREAAEDAEFVFACVGADDDLRQIAYGADGLLAGLGAGAVFVDHTTASAAIARELAAAARERGAGFLDAPVSGGQAGAENGTLTVMAGGEAADFARAETVIGAYARMIRLMGAAGAGQLTKMVNQICIAGTIQGLAEALNFAIAAGLDANAAAHVISKGAAQSWQMDNRAHTMIDGEFEFGFAVKWMRKDLRMCLEEAEKLGIGLPATALIDQYYAEVEAMGGTRWDTSSLIARLRPPRSS